MANPKDISRRQPYTVLLVAESEEGARQVERALARMEMFHLIARVQSGQDAIACLKGEGRFANRDYFPFPDIVMLDVTSDAFPVLEWLRSRTPRPVMAAFAKSDDHSIRKRTEELRADLYEPKIWEDATFERFIHFAGNIVEARRRERI